MKKIAVIMADGFEEGETLTIVDVLRRCELECHTFALKESKVQGMHDIWVEADGIINEEIKNYDMLVIPGGQPGGNNLCQCEEILDLLRYFNDNRKYIAAICSGTLVLERAEVINGRTVTGNRGYESRLISGKFIDRPVVVDQNIITSQAPGTTFPFAFEIAEIMGRKTDYLKERMLYNLAKGV